MNTVNGRNIPLCDWRWLTIIATMGLLERVDSAYEDDGDQDEPASPKEQLKQRVHERLISEVDFGTLEDENRQAQREAIKPRVQDILLEEESEGGTTFSRSEQDTLVNEIMNAVLGLGPIEPLLKDDSVSEIMVNGPDAIYVERGGTVEQTDVTFKDDEHVQNIIQRIVSPIGRRVDESQPYCDARLPDGSRVNIIIPPLALNGPTITIRKFRDDPFSLDELIRFDTLTQQSGEFLKACVQIGSNIIISGGTGSGKTTTLNCLSQFVPESERIITVEDSAELQLQRDHVISLETRPPNIEGEGEVTMRELVRNALRMRPDRIIVGECRGGEAIDMLQAMNTGHDGSMTTLHANNSLEALSRLETLVMMSGMELPQQAIREQIVNAIDLIVQQDRFRDGTRRVTEITELTGIENDTPQRSDIFKFEQKESGPDEVEGELKPTGVRPSFYKRFEQAGIDLPRDLFVET